MPDQPRITAAGRRQLARFAATTVHVYRDPGYPGRPGPGIPQAVLDKLRADGLVQLGDYQPLKGRPVLVTDLGRAVLGQAGAEAAG